MDTPEAASFGDELADAFFDWAKSAMIVREALAEYLDHHDDQDPEE